ncbi:MAG: CvpA family protein [Tannerella sp.]|jgi:membrane protein required for colicin V production|nr:CvpA family protein [Tannerella sp.]
MNWLDIVILCLAGAGLLKGLFDGIIKQVASLVAMIIGIYLCDGSAGWIRGYLTKLDWLPSHLAVMTSYILGFILVVGFIILVGFVVHRIISVTPLSIFNHIAGGLLGLLMMALCISLMLNVIEMFDHNSVILSQELKVESRFYFPLKNTIPAFFPGNIFVQNNWF